MHTQEIIMRHWYDTKNLRKISVMLRFFLKEMCVEKFDD